MTSYHAGSASTGSPGSGSVGGLSPNSSEDSGFATTPTSVKKTVHKLEKKMTSDKGKYDNIYSAFTTSIVKKNKDDSSSSTAALLLQSETSIGTGTVPRFRNSICYARSSS